MNPKSTQITSVTHFLGRDQHSNHITHSPSGERSAVFMKLGAELLKIFVLSPPTTTSGPSRETRTAKLCSVIATIESLVSRRPSNTYSKNGTTLSRTENPVFPLFLLPSIHVKFAALFNFKIS